MSTPGQIKQKQRLMSNPAIGWVITDLLLILNKEMGEEDIELEDVARASRQLIQRLKRRYKEQVQGIELIPKQRDLESLIEECKLEEQWKKQQG